MGSVASTIQGRMLCASNVAYSIPFQYPPTGSLPKNQPYYDGVGYNSLPKMITSNEHHAEAACTVGLNADGIIVAFRGTVYNSPLDWINDLLVSTVVAPNIPGAVHDGFNKAVNALFGNGLTTAIASLQNSGNARPVFFTGHSKGAGMTPIASYYAKNLGINVNQSYIFAPPLSGDSVFATAYNLAFPNTNLYENYQDIIAILPPNPIDAAVLIAELLKLNTYTSDALAAAMAYMAYKDYGAVGTLSNTFYIPAPVNNSYKIKTMTIALQVQQLTAIINVINSGNLSLFMDAHHPQCGYGYMSAINPTLCK